MRISKQEEAMYLEKYTPLIMKSVRNRMRKYSSSIMKELYEDLKQEAILAFIEFIRSDSCHNDEDILMKADNHIRFRIYSYIAKNQPMSIPAYKFAGTENIIMEEYDEALDTEIYSRNFENTALINVVTDMMQSKHRHYAKFLMEGFTPTSYNDYYNVPYTTTVYWMEQIRKHFAEHGYSPFGALPGKEKKQRKLSQSSALCPA